MVYRFGPFELRTREGRLLHHGAELALQPHSLRLLEYLVAQHPRVVSKGELLEAVWEAHVAEGAVRTAVGVLRAELSVAPGEYIATVRGRGYRFVAPLAGAPEPSPPALLGREPELAHFEALLPAPFVLALHGVPGVGKSTLAAAMASRARTSPGQGLRVSTLIASAIRPTPERVEAALAPSAELVVVDDYDHWRPIDDWLRSYWKPRHPEVRLLLVARSPVDVKWRGVPDFHSLAVEGLPPDAGAELLGTPGARGRRRSRAFTGHPLALRMLRAAGEHASPASFDELADLFWKSTPSSAHARLLELGALGELELAQVERLFEDPAPLLRWAATLPFVEIADERLRVHAVAAAAFTARLARESQSRFAQRALELMGVVNAELAETDDPRRRLALAEQIHRIGLHAPTMREEWSERAAPVELADDSDTTPFLAELARRRGAAASAEAARALERGATLWVVRGSAGTIAGGAIVALEGELPPTLAEATETARGARMAHLAMLEPLMDDGQPHPGPLLELLHLHHQALPDGVLDSYVELPDAARWDRVRRLADFRTLVPRPAGPPLAHRSMRDGAEGWLRAITGRLHDALRDAAGSRPGTRRTSELARPELARPDDALR